MTTEMLERGETPGADLQVRRLNLCGTLLVHLATEGSSDALRLAVELAQRSGAAVLGVAAEAFDGAWFAGMEYTPGSVLQDWDDALRDRITATKSVFDQQTLGLEGRAQWCGEQASPCEALTRHAGGADWLVAVRPPKEKGANVAARPADLITHTGLPVLLAPDNGALLEARRIIIGWRDTREARRAIANAMPLLTAAEEVWVVSIGHEPTTEADRASLDEVCRRLAQCGCNVVGEQRPFCRPGVGAMLVRAAEEKGADLIVMGGYAHSRVQEWVLGGVTSELCASCPVYVLVSH
jgi:nucleotide-binding universal stress UspA family protein